MAELAREGIIVKKGKKYQLSNAWLEEIRNFSHQTLANYKLGIKNNVFDKGTTQIHLKSLDELGNFMLEAIENNLLEKKHKEGFFCILNHLWIPFISKEKQTRLLAIKEKINVVYTKKSMLDSILDKTCYRKHVNKIKFVNATMDYEFFTYNNCLIQIYLPAELTRVMNNLYSGITNPFQKIADLFTMTYKKFPINIIITRNADVTKKHRQKVKEFLKK